MFSEENIANKAESYYGAFRADTGVYTQESSDNWNRKIVLGLSDMIVKIWNEWKSDTRHYSPSKMRYEEYLDTVKRAERRLDPEGSGYEVAQAVIRDCKRSLKLVVLYRVRNGKCRVM